MNGIYLLRAVATCLTLVGVLLHANCACAEEPVSRSTFEQRLAAYYAPPEEFVGDAVRGSQRRRSFSPAVPEPGWTAS